MKTAKLKRTANKDKRPLTEANIAKLERDFDFGSGLEVIVGTSTPKGEKPTYYYSNKMEKLKLKTGREINIAVSSIEVDNEQLLHSLLKNTRN